MDQEEAAIANENAGGPKPGLRRFKVQGMHCASCAVTIERALKELPGIKEAQVNFAAETLSVRADASLSAEAVAARVAAAGYAAEPLGRAVDSSSLTLHIGGMHCATCAQTVTNALEKVPGVRRAQVNFAAETAQVEIEPGVEVSSLIEAVRAAGYEASEPEVSQETQRLRAERAEARRDLGWLALSLAGAAATLVLEGRPGTAARLATLVAGLGVVITAGATFYRGAYIAARNRTANMDTLVALGITASAAYSTLTTFPAFFFAGPRFFDTAALLVLFIRFGKYLESRARRRAMAAMRALLDLVPPSAALLADGGETAVPVSRLKPGDVVLVRPAARVPVDGVVIEGASLVDESMLTGEALPAAKRAESEVTGGTLNLAAPLTVKATRVGSATVLAQMVRMVEEAQADKAPIQRTADYVAARFVPAVIAIAAATLAAWLWLGAEPARALTAMTAVLVVACPCAMGLATPAALMVGSAVGLRMGILFKRASALELITRVSVMLFDKTGTLTRGWPSLRSWAVFEGDTDRTLALAAGLAAASVHPLSRALLAWAEARGLPVSPAQNCRELPGLGIVADPDGGEFALGNERLMEQRRVDLTAPARAEAASFAAAGVTPLYFASAGRAVAVLGFEDEIRPQAAAAIAAIRAQGIRVAVISGDHRQVVEQLARRLGLDEFHAQMTPQDKIALVRRYREAGSFVAMVGDGINDAPALAAADLGIAVGSGTDAAKETGDVVLTGSDLEDLVRALALGRLTLRKVRQNLFWAFFYNSLGIPVAAGLLYPWFGLTLSPALAGLAMALSSVSVVLNALLLGVEARGLGGHGRPGAETGAAPARASAAPALSGSAPLPSNGTVPGQTATYPANATAAAPAAQGKDKTVTSKLKCPKCGYETETPLHCKRPMHIEQVNGSPQLVCWMGPDCGTADIPRHCGTPMQQAS